MFFSKFSTFYAPASAKHPQTNRGSPFTERFPFFAQHPLPPWPGAEPCLWQLFWSLSNMFDENLMKNHVFLCCSLNFSSFYAPASAKHPQTNRGSPFTERFPSFAQLPLPPGPERNPAVGNLDNPLQARRSPRRV